MEVLCRYNTVMKLVFLGTSLSIIYFMRFHPTVRASYDKEQDTFRSVFLLVPCAVLALIINQERTAIEVRIPLQPVPFPLSCSLQITQYHCHAPACAALPHAVGSTCMHIPKSIQPRGRTL